jgi:glutamyl-tRNA synthetase
MNAEYIRTMPLPELLPFVRPELKAAKLWRDEYDDADREWFERTIDLIRARFFTLKDFSLQGRAYFSEDYDFDPAAVAKNLMKFPELREWLPELSERFATEFETQPYTEENIEAVVKTFAEERSTKLGVIMNGARTMLTGVAVGPSMLSVFETIGLDRTVVRLKSQLPWNE